MKINPNIFFMINLQCAKCQLPIICLLCYLWYFWASLVAQLVENPLAMQETWVRSLGWEDPLEKEKATHYTILAWRIP